MKRLLRTLTLVLASTVLLASPAMAAETLMMATTTSTDNTGLLDYLAPKFQEDTGVELRWASTGTGQALKLGESCDVDVLMVHAPAAEKKFVEQGFGDTRTEIMYNDFVIVGPRKDPAGVKGKDVAEALGTIGSKGAVFVSRGDDSGTHKAEKGLWKAVGQDVPEKQKWYIQAGQGMMATITMAAERDGYTLTDRGTWITYEAKNPNSPLEIVVEGDKKLFNQYSVITLAPKNCPEAKHELAKKFADWIASERGQKLVAEFKLEGKQLFVPNAKK